MHDQPQKNIFFFSIILVYYIFLPFLSFFLSFFSSFLLFFFSFLLSYERFNYIYSFCFSFFFNSHCVYMCTVCI